MSSSPAPTGFSVSAQELFDAAAHFGHKTHKWNPKMRNYLFGERGGVHIFDLQKAAQKLEEGLNAIKKWAEEGKVVLFVGTKPQAIKIVSEEAKRADMPYVTSKWIPGLLTNYGTLSRRIRYLADLKMEQKLNDFEKYTKKEASKMKKMIDKLEASLGGVSNMTRIPDVVFVVDVVRDRLAIQEANRMNIPVVAVVDSNGDPDGIKFVIPGNDDALRSIQFFTAKIADAVSAGRRSTKKGL
jgi:small subunit ribosomal protein S2